MNRTDLLLAVLLLCVCICGGIIVFAVTAMFDVLRDIRRELNHRPLEATRNGELRKDDKLPLQ
jgi:hypothetical protein